MHREKKVSKESDQLSEVFMQRVTSASEQRGEKCLKV